MFNQPGMACHIGGRLTRSVGVTYLLPIYCTISGGGHFRARAIDLWSSVALLVVTGDAALMLNCPVLLRLGGNPPSNRWRAVREGLSLGHVSDTFDNRNCLRPLSFFNSSI